MTDIPSSGVGSLSTLLKRLEAATSRLEDIAIAQIPSAAAPPPFSSPAPTTTSTTVSPALVSNPSASPAAAGGNTEKNAAVVAFETIVQTGLQKYVNLSRELGGLIAQQAEQVERAFKAQADFIQLASQCTRLATSSPHFVTLIEPTQSALMAVVEIKEKSRGSKEMTQLNTVAEGIPALGWVTLDSKPGPYVGDTKESAQFYANRVVKDNKETNPKQVDWARSYIALLEELRKYVMQFHPTGLSWNAKGVDPSTYSSSSAAPSNSTVPSPPPPASGSMGGVFASLNQGEGVTSGLKKVDKSEMTHKNPELRATGIVAESATSRPQKPPKPQSFTKKAAVTELIGNKWSIENHENNSAILIEPTEINQIINVFNVKSSVIQIKGKVNAISMVNCTKTSILLDSVVSSLSISASPSFTVQILGKVPMVLIDGTDGGQIYLSKSSLDVEIVTAKSSSINVSLPIGDEEGDFVEKAIPEQLKTVVKDGKLVTSIVEHSG